MKANQCVECGREVKLRAKDQLVPIHKRADGKERCPGSEEPPFFAEIDTPAAKRKADDCGDEECIVRGGGRWCAKHGGAK